MGGSTTSLYYEGPQSLIVELGREVSSGDVVLDVPDEIVPKLLQCVGVREASKSEEKKARADAEREANDGQDGDATDKKASDETGGSE